MKEQLRITFETVWCVFFLWLIASSQPNLGQEWCMFDDKWIGFFSGSIALIICSHACMNWSNSMMVWCVLFIMDSSLLTTKSGWTSPTSWCKLFSTYQDFKGTVASVISTKLYTMLSQSMMQHSVDIYNTVQYPQCLKQMTWCKFFFIIFFF